MATFLDVGILQNFSVVFVFLLAFSVIYALLMFAKPFGKEAKGIYAIIALAIGFLVVMSEAAVLMINFMAPWFLVAIFFVFFVLIILGMFGGGKLDLIKLVSDPQVYSWIIVISVIILIFGLANTMGQTLLDDGYGGDEDGGSTTIKEATTAGDGSLDTNDFSTNMINTIFHPKVLGMLVIMLIGTIMVIFLTKASS
jgi:hypothetical protein